MFQIITKELKEIWTDLINPKTLPLKMIYLTLYSSVIIFYIQLHGHMQSLGITVIQSGYIQTMAYAITCIMPFCVGVIGDKIGNFKVWLAFATLLNGLATLLFVTVQPMSTVTQIITNITDTNRTVTNTTDTNSTVNNITDNNSTDTFWVGDPEHATEHDQDNNINTFLHYTCVRLLFTITATVTITAFEAAIMALSKDQGVDYGKQRAWGTMAAIISSGIGGVILDLVRQTDQHHHLISTDFNIIFYFGGALSGLSALMMLLMKIDFKLPAESLTNKVFKIVKTQEVAMFLLAITCGGIFMGLMEAFVYRFLASLGATPTFIGLTVTVGGVFEFVLNIYATPIVRCIGHAYCIAFAIFCFSIKFLGTSLLTPSTLNFVFILEALDSITMGLLFTAATMYCTKLGTTDTTATLRGLIGAAHGGAGKFIGALIGTELHKHFSTAVSYQTVAIFPFLISLIYAICFYYITHKDEINNRRTTNYHIDNIDKKSQSNAGDNINISIVNTSQGDAIHSHEVDLKQRMHNINTIQGKFIGTNGVDLKQRMHNINTFQGKSTNTNEVDLKQRMHSTNTNQGESIPTNEVELPQTEDNRNNPIRYFDNEAFSTD